MRVKKSIGEIRTGNARSDKHTDQSPSTSAASLADETPFDIGAGLFLCTLLFVVAAIFFMFFPNVLRDGDTGWHLAAGRYIVEHFTVPVTDPFSYTFEGQPWTAHEWLAEVLMYGSHLAFGWRGLMILVGLGFASTLALIANYALRWMTPVQCTCLLTVVLLCLLSATLARPHVLAWPFLALWTILLLTARERNKAPALGWALMILVWANLHGSYAIGLFLAAVFALEALVEAPRERKWNVIRTWGFFGFACMLAAFLTPSGPMGLLYPLMVSTMEALPLIAEWRPTSFEAPSGFSVALYLMIFFCLFRPVRLPVIRILLLVFLLHMALSHVRHQTIFAIVAGLILVEPLARAYRPDAALPHPGLVGQISARWKDFVPFFGVIALILIALVGARLVIPLARPDGPGSPGAALARLPSELRNQPVFNEYGFGGALAFEGIPVFIDGRADMYGDRFVQDYVDIAENEDIEKWQSADRKWHFRWTILGPKQKITGWLDKQPEWKRIYADKWAVVHVRQNRPDAAKASE